MRLAALRLCLDRAPSKEPFSPEKVRKVVVFLWGGRIGDTLMCTLFCNAVKAQRPDIEIAVVTGPLGADILEGCESVDRLEVSGKPGWKAALRLKSTGCCLCIHLSTVMNPTDFFGVYCLRARHNLGYDHSDYPLFDVNLPAPDSPDRQHVADRFLEAARILTGQKGPIERRFYVRRDLEADARIQAWLEAIDLQGPHIVINLFGSSRHRSFQYEPARKFLAVWNWAFPSHILILLPVPKHEEMLRRLKAELACPNIVIAPYPLAPPLSIALIRRADLVFTPDTGTVHIASALEKPVLAIYQSEARNAREWTPLSPRHAILFANEPPTPHHRSKISDFDRNEWKSSVARLIGIEEPPGP